MNTNENTEIEYGQDRGDEDEMHREDGWHDPSCIFNQFWDAGEYDGTCYCDVIEADEETIETYEEEE